MERENKPSHPTRVKMKTGIDFARLRELARDVSNLAGVANASIESAVLAQLAKDAEDLFDVIDAFMASFGATELRIELATTQTVVGRDELFDAPDSEQNSPTRSARNHEEDLELALKECRDRLVETNRALKDARKAHAQELEACRDRSRQYWENWQYARNELEAMQKASLQRAERAARERELAEAESQRKRAE